MIDLKEKPEGIEFRVRVVPRASKTEIVGLADGALRIRLKAPPVDGAANLELMRFVAKALGVPRSSVAIAAGEHSRTKTIFAANISAAAVRGLAAQFEGM
ncbi:MAG: hypothetical protein UZ17_ACD001001674 [Acidobacteria bacterium OLB17]|nr:MAG: hypothetical protein UZ17_ACD001001674 [Acidobacteria bacterium OLB17]MCZ2390733.1 DUF167 domain-containing protein [Acidobacteriota bacterium]